MPDGAVYPKQYFGFCVGNFLDSFRSEETPEITLTKSLSGYHLLGFTKKGCSSLAMSKEAMGSAHFWRERHLKFPEFFLSDVFASKISDVGLRVPNMHKVKEI